MKYVALLRGINVGGNNKISMFELKACFEKLGFGDVKTYINSGNIIFSTSKSDETRLVRSIENCIKDKFNLDIPVVIRSNQQIAEVVKAIPKEWVNNQAMRTDVLFLWTEVDGPEVLEEIKTNPEVDNLIYTAGAIIWNFDRQNYRQSKLHGFIGTHVYKLMTARNINTVRKLAGLMTGA
ncbi:MAG TPA: DUF1697 domain-containing protein [Candidatus Saccharimonadales bacterium]|nr:DUF1697 domain-containing protein [Candidatus Saccharimonadales bacterium]